MPIPSSTSVMPRSLLRDQAYDALRDAIVTGVLDPGEHLGEANLVAWLGISRTPIREALTRLEHAGLVQTSPGRFTKVSPLDARAADQVQSVLAAMHETAVREAVPRMGTAHVDAMRAANARFAAALEAADADATIAADDDFHAVAVTVCGNVALRSVIDQFTPLFRRVERVRFSALTGRASVDQHDRIVDLCAAGTAVEAALATRANWQTLTPVLADEFRG